MYNYTQERKMSGMGHKMPKLRGPQSFCKSVSKLGTVVANHSIRTSISDKVVLKLGYHSRGTCASQLVNFPKVAVVVNSNDKVFAFVREQVSGDPFPRSVWYCSASQCFLWLRTVVLSAGFARLY